MVFFDRFGLCLDDISFRFGFSGFFQENLEFVPQGNQLFLEFLIDLFEAELFELGEIFLSRADQETLPQALVF